MTTVDKRKKYLEEDDEELPELIPLPESYFAQCNRSSNQPVLIIGHSHEQDLEEEDDENLPELVPIPESFFDKSNGSSDQQSDQQIVLTIDHMLEQIVSNALKESYFLEIEHMSNEIYQPSIEMK
jgi:hypothetical protein